MQSADSETSFFLLKKENLESLTKNDLQSIYRIAVKLNDVEFEKGLLWKHCLWKHFRIRFTMEEEEFLYQLNELHSCCLVHMRDLHEVHLKRKKGIEIVNEIINRADVSYIKPLQMVHIFWCTLCCIYHFLLRLQLTSYSLVKWTRSRELDKTVRIYLDLLNFFRSDVNRILLFGVMTFLSEANLWEIESVCTNVMQHLLRAYNNIEEGLDDILKFCEISIISTVDEAKQILQILSNVLENLQFQSLSKQFFEKLITWFETSISSDRKKSIDYRPLKSGLQKCIKNIIANLNNDFVMIMLEVLLRWILETGIQGEALLDFGNVTEFTAHHFNSECVHEALPPKIIGYIFDLMSSDQLLYSLLGNRVFQNLIDKTENKDFFRIIRFFYNTARYDMVIEDACVTVDKQYFRENRDKVHNNLFYSLTKHPNNRLILDATYSTLALILVRIPCGYTAASGVCFAMAIQEYTLSNEQNFSIEHSHRLHAFVISIMSLVCYIHRADVLYNYVVNVMQYRAEWAPHLNAPLKSHYEYAEHYILWNKPELFFEDWEARYGLWKCFRSKKLQKQMSKFDRTSI